MADAVRAVLFASASASALVALWLGFVILSVLPQRNPELIGFWRVVAACFLGHAGLTFAFLVRGPRARWLRRAVRACSVAAVVLGATGIVRMVQTDLAGGHVEGYIALMGFLLAGHGVAALAYDATVARAARRADADRPGADDRLPDGPPAR